MKAILYSIMVIFLFNCSSKEKNKESLTKQLNTEYNVKKDTILKNNLDKIFNESIKKFVPVDWQISDTTSGFLNYDNYKDLILLIEKDSNQNDNFRQGDQGLIVLFGNKNGDYTLNFKLLKLLNNRTDYGMIDGKGILSIKKNRFSYSFFPANNFSKEFEFVYSEKQAKFFLIKTIETYFHEEKNDNKIEKYSINEIPIETYKVE